MLTAVREPGLLPKRLRVFQVLLILWVAAIVVRLVVLQIVDYGWLKQRAERQQSHTVELSAQRGLIYDRNLHPMAMSLSVDSIFAVPSEIDDVPAAAQSLATALGLNAHELEKRLNASRSFLWVARKVTASQEAAVKALDLHGIYFQPESKRFYPKGELAANVIGYVGMDGNGLAGIEHSYDDEIRGHTGKALIEVDARHHVYDQFQTAPAMGQSVVLTIDQNIQYIVQQELDAQVQAMHALRGMAIVENPSTGEILALANSPTFNPNQYSKSPVQLLGDPAVSDVYEPGSVFKLVTLSAGLQEGLTNPNEVIDCDMGQIEVGGRIIHDHARFGKITLTEILQHSSDVGSIKIGLRLGIDRFYKYIHAYGFGQRTGIELPGESPGLVRPPSRWTPVSIGAVSMGQEVAVTPVQIISMVSALADGGVYHAPHIVVGTYDDNSDADPPQFHPSPGRRIVSAQVAAEMKGMMEQVVLAGTGRKTQLNGYSSAGKTGTAQKVDPGGHGYSAHDVVASFAGFAPADHPAIAMLVVIDSPHPFHEGGDVAGPAWKRMGDRILPYLGIPHDLPVNVPPKTLAQRREQERKLPPHADDESFSVAAQELLGPDQALPRDAVVINGQQLGQGAPVTAPDKTHAVVVQYQGGIEVPNFAGMPVRAVSALCEKLGLDPVLMGRGVARQQAPAAGTRVTSGARVVVRFTLRDPQEQRP